VAEGGWLVANVEDVVAVFRTALELPVDLDVTTLKYLGHKHWDSIGHMSLVAGLEDRFDIMFDADDILAMSDLGQAVAILKKHHALD
jgi:acyl carrier protein